MSLLFFLKPHYTPGPDLPVEKVYPKCLHLKEMGIVEVSVNVNGKARTYKDGQYVDPDEYSLVLLAIMMMEDDYD